MDTAQQLLPCVPALLARRGARRPEAPESECFASVVLLADVSGFTPLTERLAQQGSAGAEELSRLLERLFTPLVEVVTAHGGDILHFPGDALLALWPLRAEETSLTQAAARAVACGLALQRAMHAPFFREHALALRVALGAGEVQAVIAGGVQGRWQALVRGAPFTQLREVEHATSPGEVCVSAPLWHLLGAQAQGDVSPSGIARILSLKAPEPWPLTSTVPGEDTGAALRPFVSRVLRAALEVHDRKWLAEPRRVTVLFLRLDGLPEGASEALLPRLSEAVRALQEAVYAQGGSVNQLLVDDKGLVLVSGFGLPTCAHEDDSTRAVKAAIQARALLHAQGLKASVGIATGRVCCGLRGGAVRYEYALMGRTVNLAARLMQEARDDILLDEPTAQAVGERLWTERLPPVKVKGVVEPVRRFRPGSLDAVRGHRGAPAVVGRLKERATLDAFLERPTRGLGGVLLLEGEAGLGKSRLLACAADGAKARGQRVLSGSADAAEDNTVYFAWRTVFTALLGLPEGASLEARRTAVRARLPGNAALAPLLNPVLLLELPETDRTAQLRDEARADTTQALMMMLLGEAGPCVLLLEDGQWLDSASWEFLRRLSRDLPDWLLVVSLRPLPVEPPALEALRRQATTQGLRLGPMWGEEVDALVRARLGVTRLQPEVAAFIQRKAEGHPFHSEELAHALRDHGLLFVERGECRLTPEAGDLESMGLPSTLEGLITARIDRLTPVQQLTLKAASVIGRAFTCALLRDVHPLPDERTQVGSHLLGLQEKDLALPLENAPERSYLFKHAITQEVAYNLLLFSQRRQLHEAVARWYEQRHATELTPHHPRLAYHWLRAGVHTKALDALENSGEQAMTTHAPSEAVAFFTRALELDEAGPERVPPARRARWERNLGRALRWLGRQEEARRHLLAAMTLMGHPVPTRPAARTLETAMAALRQLLGWVPGLRRVMRMGTRFAELVDLTETCADLSLLAVHATDWRGVGYYSFQMARFADKSGSPSLRARAYASLTVVLGSIPLHRAAAAYGHASLKLAHQANNRQAIAFSRLSLSMYLLNAARFRECEESLTESITGFTRLGNQRLADEATLLLFHVHLLQGRPGEAMERSLELEASGRRREDPQTLKWVREDRAILLMLAGYHEAALEGLQATSLNPETYHDPSITGLIALALLRAGDATRARVLAEQQLSAILSSALSITTVYSYTGLAETFLGLWREAWARGDKDAEHLRQHAHRLRRALEKGARSCALGLPAAHLFRGRLALAEGKPGSARRGLEAALRTAKLQGMPWEAADAHTQLAGLDESRRDWHLAEAARLRPVLSIAEPRMERRSA